MLRERADWLALFFCLIFLVLGSLWISEMGIQTDEALFESGLYPPFGSSIHLFQKDRPLMLMTYVGALKSYIWKPIIRNLGASPVTIRFPAVVLGTVTIWLFYVLMKRTLGVRAAVTGAALLSMDATFILTTRWDWGPVAIQHLCMVGGAYSIVRFSENRQLGWLFLGCFAFGLGMWDKTIFLWSLSGMGIATLIVFPHWIKRLIDLRSLLVAAGSFLLGASPLIYYNVIHDWVTFRQNAAWSWNEDVSGKVRMLVTTFEGRGMLGSVVREAWEGAARKPDDAFKRAWVTLTEVTGSQRKNLYVPLAVLAVVLAPFLWRFTAWKAFSFVCVYCAVTWSQMAFTPSAGGSPHHFVLMWPWPHLAIAAVLAEASRKLRSFQRLSLSFLAATVAMACLSNVALIGTYYSNMLRYGGVKEWTDAIYPATQALVQMRPSYVCVLDWGFFDNTRLLTRGRLDVCAAVDPKLDPVTAKRQMAIANVVYITHTPANQVMHGVTERFVEMARAEGYEKKEQSVFNDYNGRPMIEVFKLFRR